MNVSNVMSNVSDWWKHYGKEVNLAGLSASGVATGVALGVRTAGERNPVLLGLGIAGMLVNGCPLGIDSFTPAPRK